jgi:hypothetical protein
MFEKMMVRGLLAAAFAASVANATASTLTYKIVDYPAYESDVYLPSTDTIAGTIITDGAIGPLSTSDIVGGSYTISNPTVGNFTVPVLGNITISGTVLATSSALTIPLPPSGQGNTLQLDSDQISNDIEQQFIFNYRRINEPQPYTYDQYNGFEAQSHAAEGGLISRLWFSAQANYPSYLQLGSSDPWVVATATPVPEPGALALLLPALGFGIVNLRRRKVRV